MASPSGSPGPSQSSPKPTASPPASGAPAIKTIGKYEIQKKIGAGGMGAVYLALDPMLKRNCALKVLPQDKAGNPTLVKRFKAEAASAAKLRHENIVSVYEADQADGYQYIALEYVEGTDVGKLVERRGTVPLKRSLEIVRQVAKALKHAFEEGIVHRDIKPGNLLLRRDGVVKLADLGLARSLDDTTDTSITRAGTTVGTVDYMSPEQARDSRAADIRSDIYSLGCTWYFMLTGEPPFPAGSLTNKLRAHAETPIPDPRSINPGVSEAVFGVIRRMTEKKPAKRYQDPSELLADLDAAALTSDIVTDTILSDSSEEPGDEEGPAPVRLDDSSQSAEVEAPARPRRRRETDDETEAPARGRRRETDAQTEAPSRPRRREADDESPTFKPPPRRDKAKNEADEKPRRNNAILFYGILGLLLVGLVVVVIALFREYGGALDPVQSDRMGDPFKARDEVSKAAGGASDAARPRQGNSGAQNPAAQNQGTAVSPEQGSDPSAKGQSGTANSDDGGTQPAGAGSSLVASGPTKTLISTGEGGKITSETTGPNSRGSTGPSAVPPSARTKAEMAFLPGWAGSTHPTSGLTALVVQAGASGERHYASLNDALANVPATGAVIQLAGNGPFPLRPVKISDRARIVIEPQQPADASSAPLVVLVPPPEGLTAHLFELSNTVLELRRVHLAIDAAIGADPDAALVAVDGGDLFIEGCSISARGAASAPLTAIAVSGRSMRPDAKFDPRVHVLVENTLVRGENLTALAIGSEHADVAVRNSLVWSGTAPALRFSTLARSDADSQRDLHLASTTLCSKGCAVQLGGDASQPVPTSIAFLNSLVAAPVGSRGAALLRMQDWNQNQQKTALGKFINWKSTDTLYTGWPTLIELAPGGVAAAASTAQWQAAWRDKSASDKTQFRPDPWPHEPIGDVSAAPLDLFAPQTVGKQVVKTADGGWPGCLPEALRTVRLGSIDVVQTAASRPEIPRGMFGFPATETIRIDARDDVGKVLDRKQLANGTEIVISGSGPRPTSPIVIQNAWVRVRFEPEEGPPLVLTPRGSDSSHKREALITVMNGGLELTGCVFTIPAAGAQAVPKWFIQVVDGDLAMWRCRLQGPQSNAPTRNVGLIQWLRSTGAPPERAFAGSYNGYLAIQDCFLLGSGTLIEADIRKRAMIFRNSVLVSRDDLVSLNLGEGDPQIGGVVDAHFCTFSAADRFFQVHGSDLGEASGAPLAVFADRTAFAPPLRSGSQPPIPTVLAYSGPVLEQRQMVWWENRCGYAHEIGNYLRPDSEPPSPTAQDFEQTWIGQWGADQVVEPLRGIKGVVLKSDLPTRADERSRLEPSDFQLQSGTKGATWADGKEPIGAYVTSMHLPPIRGSGPAPKSKPAKAPAGNPPQEGF